MLSPAHVVPRHTHGSWSTAGAQAAKEVLCLRWPNGHGFTGVPQNWSGWCCFATPVKHMSSSVGMMTFPIIIWEKKRFQTTNQWFIPIAFSATSRVFPVQSRQIQHFPVPPKSATVPSQQRPVQVPTGRIYLLASIANPMRLCFSERMHSPRHMPWSYLQNSSIVWTNEPHWINSLMYT